MSQKVTIGGDRLGSGKKMKAELHGYERSTHDLGYVWRSTMAPGTLVPFLCKPMLPGDTFDISLHCDIKTHPTVGPLFGTYKTQLDVFFIPMRLYNSLLHNNELNIGRDMSQVKLPQLSLTAKPLPTGEDADIDNSQINPSCILHYLGIKGVGVADEPTPRHFNAIPYLGYIDIYKNYYANKQEGVGAVIHTLTAANVETIDQILVHGSPILEAPGNEARMLNIGELLSLSHTGAAPIPAQIYFNTLEWGRLQATQLAPHWHSRSSDSMEATFINAAYGPTVTIINWEYALPTDVNIDAPNVQFFDLEDIDTMRGAILSYRSKSTAFNLYGQQPLLEPYKWLLEGSAPLTSSQEGLLLKTYQNDLFNNWINEEWIDGSTGVNEISAISTVGDKFTIDALNLAKKVYDMLNRIAISGGTYKDYIEVSYDVNNSWQPEIPVYMGGLIKEVVFQEVISNSESADGQPLGALAGRGVMGKKHKGGEVYIKATEAGYVMGIISLTPRVDYSQGNDWHINIETMADWHVPALDQIGFEDSINEYRAWWSTKYNGTTSEWEQTSAGKVPAWINYMTSVNEVHGNFAIANNEMFMVLNRRFEQENGNIKDLTTYIDPSKFNFIFAETALDAQNFWCQIGVDITARRKMSAKVMPNP